MDTVDIPPARIEIMPDGRKYLHWKNCSIVITTDGTWYAYNFDNDLAWMSTPGGSMVRCTDERTLERLFGRRRGSRFWSVLFWISVIAKLLRFIRILGG